MKQTSAGLHSWFRYNQTKAMPAQGFEELPVPRNGEDFASGAVVEAMDGVGVAARIHRTRDGKLS